MTIWIKNVLNHQIKKENVAILGRNRACVYVCACTGMSAQDLSLELQGKRSSFMLTVISIMLTVCQFKRQVEKRPSFPVSCLRCFGAVFFFSLVSGKLNCTWLASFMWFYEMLSNRLYSSMKQTNKNLVTSPHLHFQWSILSGMSMNGWDTQTKGTSTARFKGVAAHLQGVFPFQACVLTSAFLPGPEGWRPGPCCLQTPPLGLGSPLSGHFPTQPSYPMPSHLGNK